MTAVLGRAPRGRWRRAGASIGLLVVAAARGPIALGQPAGTLSALGVVDTWTERPWRLTAGAFAQVVDVALAPDGDRWLLDGAQPAVHRLAPDGTPRAVWPFADRGIIPGDGWAPQRLAVHRASGELAVLATRELPSGARRSLIIRLSAAGDVVHRFETDGTYRDIGYLLDGRLILPRTRPRVVPTPGRGTTPRLPGGLDVYTPAGDLSAVIEPAELFLPVALAVASNGDVHVVNWLPLPAGVEPGPEPTPRPSARHPHRRAMGGAVEGVVTFDAALRHVRSVPFDAADDVAVGQGVFVSRQAEVFALGDGAPVWTGPTNALSVPYYGRMLSLAADPAGDLVAAMSHCSFQGAVELGGLAGGQPPAFHGRLDRPPLAGPLAPLRLSADRTVAVLQARFDALDGPGRAPVWVGRSGAWPQSIQRLTMAGHPIDQLGVCGDDQVWFEVRSDVRWAVDTAVAADWVFEGGPDVVTASRAGGDQPLPAWHLWLGAVQPSLPAGDAAAAFDLLTPHLGALDANGRRLTALDQGRSMLLLVDLDRAIDDPVAATTAWPIALPDGNVPVDVALGRSQVFLADEAGRRVIVTDLRGRIVRDFAVHDAPRAIAVVDRTDDASGVFVLGRHGWVLHYGEDGRLLARGRTPERGVGSDVTGLGDGRAGVAFMRQGNRAAGDPADGGRVEQGGVWVFAPRAASPSTASPPEACLIMPDKVAWPPEVRLGDAVTVTLTTSGTCPAAGEAGAVVIVLDTSRSMGWDGAFERAQKALLAVLARLDGRRTRVGLVAFADQGIVLEPVTADLARIARAVSALAPNGDTRLAGGLAAADQALRDAAPAPVRQSVLLVTDGEFKDYPIAAAQAMAARGVGLFALTIPLRSYTVQTTRALAGLFGEGHVFVDPDASGAAAVAATVAPERAAARLLEAAVVTDTLPVDMGYVPGSAVPAADWDAASRTLTWHSASVALTETLTLRYAARPAVTGDRPTNVGARLTGRDGVGRSQTLDFPVPRVKVWDRTTLTRRAYLPLGIAGACVRPPPGDIVLVLDASRSMDASAAPLPGSKLEAAESAAIAFADRLGAHGARAGLVTFAETAVVRTGLTADRSAWAQAMSDILTAPGTRIDRGLAEAEGLLAREGREGGRGAVVLLTDGHASGPREAVVAAAGALAVRGTLLFAIALGADADVGLLGQVVRPANGLVRAVDAAAVGGAFDAVFEGLRCAP